MPTYEYRCAKCGHEFERVQRITEKPIRRCPSCSSLQAKRLISSTAFVLKGGGWYSDLYASKKSGAGAGKGADKGADKGAEKGADKGEDKSGAGKSESKSEPAKSDKPSKPSGSRAA